jgi:CheY-like chemotaxis protein
VLDLADRLLGEIDRIVEVSAAPPIDIVGNVLQSIRPLGEAGLDTGAVASRILVVDDHEANRELLSRRLVREGYRVMAAESGAAALALTVAEDFDFVLLDLIMPGMSGFEVLCRLKAGAGTRHVPVIMISALDELDSTVRCIEAGAEDYLPKPFNLILLRARIGASLEKKRLLDELRAEKERSEALLLNILPGSIVERMRRGETVIAPGCDHSFFRPRRFYLARCPAFGRGDGCATGRHLLSVRRSRCPARARKDQDHWRRLHARRRASRGASRPRQGGCGDGARDARYRRDCRPDHW